MSRALRHKDQGGPIDHRAAFICHLAHRTQRIHQEILSLGAAHLRNPLQAIGIRVYPVTQNLRQPGIEIIHIRNGITIHCLLQAVSKAIITITGRGLSPAYRPQPVGRIIGIGVRAIVQQVPIGVPGVRDTPHRRQPVGDIVGVRQRGRQPTDYVILAQAVADRIIFQAVERIVGVVDRLGDHLGMDSQHSETTGIF